MELFLFELKNCSKYKRGFVTAGYFVIKCIFSLLGTIDLLLNLSPKTIQTSKGQSIF